MLEFKDLKNMKDIAEFLEVDIELLKNVLFAKRNYFSFSIPKRDGSFRIINAPKKNLNDIQKKILIKLSIFYVPKKCVHGFVKNKSILTNAIEHCNNKNLLNLDLTNFFPTINFNRVKRLLMSKPFYTSEKAAIMIANLLTYNGTLPQGACTSPLLSNMICRRMDNRLSKFCQNNNVVYTRYADDLSFSWNKDAKILVYDKKNKSVNFVIQKIIEEEGFIINEKKTKYATPYNHKEVTGIVINEKINIKKDYYYRLKSMINDAIKHGLETAYSHYCEKRKIRFDPKRKKFFVNVLLGMFNFYSMLNKNEKYESERYKKISKKINILLQYNYCIIKYKLDELKKEACFILKNENEDGGMIFGTIFRFDKYYITCKHCLMETKKYNNIKGFSRDIIGIQLSKNKYYIIDYEGNQIMLGNPYISEKYDIAIFLDEKYYENTSFNSVNINVKIEDNIKILGFPDYANGDKINILNGKITGSRELDPQMLGTSKITYYTTDVAIITGNSGGPVLNERMELIGIVEFGQEASYYNLAKVQNGICKIEYLLEEIKNIEENKFFK